MIPSYSSQKAVHDQMIREALEHYHPDDGQSPRRPSRRQVVARVLSRYTARGGRKQGRPLPCGAQGESGALAC
jgi:hypothetical protein